MGSLGAFQGLGNERSIEDLKACLTNNPNLKPQKGPKPSTEKHCPPSPVICGAK